MRVLVVPVTVSVSRSQANPVTPGDPACVCACLPACLPACLSVCLLPGLFISLNASPVPSKSVYNKFHLRMCLLHIEWATAVWRTRRRRSLLLSTGEWQFLPQFF